MHTDKMISRKDGGVGWMIFNNPERHNAISLEMWEAALEIMLSVPPPGAYGTTTSMFFDGYLAWPNAAPDDPTTRANDAAEATRNCRTFIPKFLR